MTAAVVALAVLAVAIIAVTRTALAAAAEEVLSARCSRGLKRIMPRQMSKAGTASSSAEFNSYLT